MMRKVLIKDFWNGECLPDISQCYDAMLHVPGAEGAVGEVVLTQHGPVLSHLLAGEIGTLGSGTPAAYLAGSAAGTASAIGAASTVGATGLAALGVLGAAGIAVAASGGSSKKTDSTGIENPSAPSALISKDGKTVSGKAQPNSIIKIDTDKDGVADITTTADANGNFSVDISNNPLRPGQNIDVTATDSAGNQSPNVTVTAPIDSTGSINTGGLGGSSGGSSQPSPQQPNLPQQPSAEQQALAKIKAYADSNGGTTAPDANDYQLVGATGLTKAQVDAANSALADDDITSTQVNDNTAVQDIVNKYNKILAAADGTANAANSLDNLDYSTIGVNNVPVDSSTEDLLNDIVDQSNTDEVNTVRELQDLANAAKVVTDLTNAADGSQQDGQALVEALGKLGVTGATVGNAAQIADAIAKTANDGTEVNSQEKLQDIVDTATAPQTPADTTPPEITNSDKAFSYQENSLDDTVIGTVTAVDNDSAIAGYEIVSGNDEGYFNINGQGQITLTAKGVQSAANDFETGANTFTLGVSATSEGETATFTLNLTNVQPATPVLSLQNDTGLSSTDKITSDKMVTVGNTESNATLEYMIDGVGGWVQGDVSALNLAILENNEQEGKEHTVKVRQTVNGEVSDEAELVFVHDVVAPTTDQLVVNLKNGNYVLLGKTEPGSRVSLTNHSSTQANGSGQFELNLGKNLQDSKPKLTVTDQAGNSSDPEPINIGVYANINTLGGTDINIVRGNITEGADIFYAEGYTTNGQLLDLQGGDDTLAITNGGVYSTAVKATAGRVNMGAGNDTISAKYITGVQTISMGEGDDKIILNSEWVGATSIGGSSKVNLGAGDDTVEVYNIIQAYSGALDGGMAMIS